MIFSMVATAFFNIAMLSMTMRFTQQHFIKRKWMINKKVIRDELVIMEINIAIRVKETASKFINQGIIANAKHNLVGIVE